MWRRTAAVGMAIVFTVSACASGDETDAEQSPGTSEPSSQEQASATTAIASDPIEQALAACRSVVDEVAPSLAQDVQELTNLYVPGEVEVERTVVSEIVAAALDPAPDGSLTFSGVAGGDTESASFAMADGDWETAAKLLLGDYLQDAYECFTRELGVPARVGEQIRRTRALDGAQSATWDDMAADWSFHPDDGLSITFYTVV